MSPPASPPRIVIIGAGAVGCHLAHALRPGVNVLMVDPSDAVRAGLRARGLPATAPSELGEAHPQVSERDVPVIATSAAVAQKAAGIVPKGVPLVCVANGLLPGLESERAGDLALGVVEFAASSPGPGEPLETKPGWLTLQDSGAGRGADAASRCPSQRLHSAIDPARQRVRLSTDIHAHRHSKLLLNASLDPVAAVIGGTIGDVFRHRQAFRAFRVLLREGLAVARASGWTLHKVQGTHPATMGRVFAMPVLSRLAARIASVQARAVQSTLARELARGQIGEADYLSGAIVRQGATVGVPTPAHARALEVLHEVAAGARGGRLEFAARLIAD